MSSKKADQAWHGPSRQLLGIVAVLLLGSLLVGCASDRGTEYKTAIHEEMLALQDFAVERRRLLATDLALSPEASLSEFIEASRAEGAHYTSLFPAVESSIVSIEAAVAEAQQDGLEEVSGLRVSTLGSPRLSEPCSTMSLLST